jgi:hypothetical protein
LTRKLSDFVVDDPKGIVYVVKVFSILPPRFWERKGLVNEIVCPRLQVPWALYKLKNYCRQAKNGKMAAKENYVAYRYHKVLESRQKVDKILEHRAWDRVLLEEDHCSKKECQPWQQLLP